MFERRGQLADATPPHLMMSVAATARPPRPANAAPEITKKTAAQLSFDGVGAGDMAAACSRPFSRKIGELRGWLTVCVGSATSEGVPAMKKHILGVAVALALLPAAATAAPVFTTGAGSAVSTADRSANFNSLTPPTSQAAYSEGGLSITIPAPNFQGFDPTVGNGGFSGGFFYANGAVAPVVIGTTDASELFAVEFNIGTGYDGNSTVFGAYELFDGATSLGGGTFAVAAGSVVGFLDATGFTSLHLGAYQSAADAAAALAADFGPSPGFATANGAALDNLVAQLFDGDTGTIPEPASIAALIAGLFGLGVARRRRAQS